jgi:hypothetical protein
MELAQPVQGRMKLPRAEASAIRDRIMKEMLALEEERVERMKGSEGEAMMRSSVMSGSSKTIEDEGIIRRELNKVDPSAVIFSESWAAKKVSFLPCGVIFSIIQYISRLHTESDTEWFSIWASGQLGLCVGDREDRRRLATRTAGCATHP